MTKSFHEDICRDKPMTELEKSYRLKHSPKRNSSSLHLINLKTILPPMTMISKSKIFVLLILVLQMKYRLRK